MAAASNPKRDCALPAGFADLFDVIQAQQHCLPAGTLQSERAQSTLSACCRLLRTKLAPAQHEEVIAILLDAAWLLLYAESKIDRNLSVYEAHVDAHTFAVQAQNLCRRMVEKPEACVEILEAVLNSK